MPVFFSDFELLPPELGHSFGRTSDSLAAIAGESHTLRLWGSGGASAAAAQLVIYIGQKNDAANVTLCNLLPVPVVLGNRSSGSRVWSVGAVTDTGKGNRVVQLHLAPSGGGQLPVECAPLG